MTVTIISADTTDALVPLSVTCKCPSGRRVLPIRMARATLGVFGNNGTGSQLVMTYRCHSCSAIVPIRIQDIVQCAT